MQTNHWNKGHGVHVFWTKPWRERANSDDLVTALPPLEQFVLVASALIWRQHSGPCVLYTDRLGFQFLKQRGLTAAWDAIDTECLEHAPSEINASVFWDIGKTLVLSVNTTPITMMDLDLIVWRPIEDTAPVLCYHWEEAEAPWYVGPDLLALPDAYVFGPNWDWSRRIANTALMRITDEDFLAAFCRESLRFASNNPAKADEALSAFLFSGQRLFSLVAGELGVEQKALLPYSHSVYSTPETFGQPFPLPFEPWRLDQNHPATHLWSQKHHLRGAPTAARGYSRQVVQSAVCLSGELAERLERYRNIIFRD